MSDFSKPVIINGPNDLLQLGHRTKHGIQTSVDNWLNITEAMAYCEREKIRPTLMIFGEEISWKVAALMVALLSGPEPTAMLAVSLHTSIGALRKWATSKPGLFTLEPCGKKAGDHVLHLTDGGADVARRLSGALNG
jgi:hypothetical protein